MLEKIVKLKEIEDPIHDYNMEIVIEYRLFGFVIYRKNHFKSE